jgi:hypothetical protein
MHENTRENMSIELGNVGFNLFFILIQLAWPKFSQFPVYWNYKENPVKIPQTRIQASHKGQKGVGAYLSMKTKLCISSKPQDSTSNFAVAKTTPINNAVD